MLTAPSPAPSRIPGTHVNNDCTFWIWKYRAPPLNYPFPTEMLSRDAKLTRVSVHTQRGYIIRSAWRNLRLTSHGRPRGGTRKGRGLRGSGGSVHFVINVLPPIAQRGADFLQPVLDFLVGLLLAATSAGMEFPLPPSTAIICRERVARNRKRKRKSDIHV